MTALSPRAPRSGQRPLTNVGLASEMIGSSFPTANKLVSRFEELGLLREITGQRRSRVFRYDPYIDLFGEPDSDIWDDGEPETTEASGDS